jgi:neurotrimin
VSWVRRRDWHILTADSKVYSRDERIRVTSVDSTENTWTLLIKYIQKDDEGIYDCQVEFKKFALEINTRTLKVFI